MELAEGGEVSEGRMGRTESSIAKAGVIEGVSGLSVCGMHPAKAMRAQVVLWGWLPVPRYFLSNWNCLDCFVVLSGLPAFLMHGSSINITVLRVVKVVRPLRSLSHMKGLKNVMETLVGCLQPLLPVLYLFVLAFGLFSILGVQFFSGSLNQACYHGNHTEATVMLQKHETVDRACGGWFQCPMNTSCMVHHDSYNYNALNFNDFGHSALTLFVAVTEEGWVDTMYLLQDSR